MSKVYRCTPGDLEIFEQAKSNANVFLNFYMKGDQTGTAWSADMTDEGYLAGYHRLREAWEQAGRPEPLFTIEDPQGGLIRYQVRWDLPDDPTFWHSHGWLFLDWQLAWHHARQPERTIIGGFGSGKTAAAIMSLLVEAAITPYYRAVVVSEDSIQGLELFEYARRTLPGTLYAKRFGVRMPMKPFPHIVVRNSHIGESGIEFYSVKGGDTDKLRTLEVDRILVEQAERIVDLEALDRDLGSRMRGHVRGRPRLAFFDWVANAGINPELWYRFEQAELDPENYYSKAISYRDNPYLTQRDLKNLERRAGKTKEEKDQWLKALKPIGTGKHFSKMIVDQCRNQTLEEVMEKALAEGQAGYYHEKAERAGTVRWEMPPDPARQYLLIADPGLANPPYRNSPVLGVWDITDFPKGPATLRAFWWVSGNADPWNWINAFLHYARLYRTQNRSAFDATGPQSGYDHLVFAQVGFEAIKINMGGTYKMLALNAARMTLGRVLLSFPYIQHLWAQLLNYNVPDTRLRQDIVMMIAMTCMWLEGIFFEPEEGGGTVEETPQDRYARPQGDRYARDPVRTP